MLGRRSRRYYCCRLINSLFRHAYNRKCALPCICCDGSLVTWKAVCLTAIKFKTYISVLFNATNINLLGTKSYPSLLKTQSVPRCKHSLLRL